MTKWTIPDTPEVARLRAEVERLREEVARVMSDRAFIIGANHGWDECLAQIEPACVRHSFDGHGWQYIDSGSGSDWLERGMQMPDAQVLYDALSGPAPGEGEPVIENADPFMIALRRSAWAKR